MAFLVLMIMLLALFVLFFWSIVKKKPIKKLLLSYVGILLGYFFLVDFACGPNSHDVKIMKPQAKAIADYIVKNGIPKSMVDIPDLPYALVECGHRQQNLELCTFYRDDKKYSTEIYIFGYMSIEIYAYTTKTGLRYELIENNSKNQWAISKHDILSSSKSSGICRTFRQ